MTRRFRLSRWLVILLAATFVVALPVSASATETDEAGTEGTQGPQCRRWRNVCVKWRWKTKQKCRTTWVRSGNKRRKVKRCKTVKVPRGCAKRKRMCVKR